MFTVTDVLLTAGVKFSVYAGRVAGNVYITHANQLIGSYKDLEIFRTSDSNYSGWHVHHVVEDDDLYRLGVSKHARTDLPGPIMCPDARAGTCGPDKQHPATREPDPVSGDRPGAAPRRRSAITAGVVR